jgi:hypothetical protein
MSAANTPPADGYLARVSRELRADRAPAEELRVEPLARIQCGRRELVVELTTSTRHGVSCYLRALAPAPTNEGQKRLEQGVWLYPADLDALLAALTEARSRLATAAPKRPRGAR